MAVTFPVSDVQPAVDLLKEQNYFQAIETQLDGPVESCAWHHKPLIPCQGNAFAAAIHLAYDGHRPLVLSPDHLWLVLCQGLALHIHQNQEALRHHFVQHQGKKKLDVVRGDFKLGNPLNPWTEVITAFSDQIKQHIGQHHNLITAQFSTTGDLEKAAFEVTLMDAMKGYFIYWMSLCGIPSITLEGTTQDWLEISQRIQRFRAFDLDWWVDRLEPILTEFVAASKGEANTVFWQDIYKRHNDSGGPYISGWMIKLFPYLAANNKVERNRYIEKDPSGAFGDKGISSDYIPHGLSCAPFKFDDGLRVHDMDFLAGFVGVAQDHETKALRPEIGWAVRNVAVFKAAQKNKKDRFTLS